MTGYGTQANEQRAKAADVSAFLNKPLSPQMIEESAAHALLAPAPAVVAPMPAAAVEVAATVQPGHESRLKNIALFLAAPFIGLAYAVMLPFVGIAMLAWTAVQALRDQSAKK